jgi:Rha family phage regulatory protein
MDHLISIVDGKPMVSSKQVADHFEIVGGHRYIMSVIRKLLIESGEFGVQNYLQSSYVSKQNKKLDCFDMTRDGFTLIAMGLTGKKAQQWKIKYIEAFNKMESEILHMQRKTDSVMDKLNSAYKLMQDDKEKASCFGAGLAEWKRIKKEHMELVNQLKNDVQFLLNLS